MPEPTEDSWVPVEKNRLTALGPAAHRAERAAVAQRAAVARLLELADDLRADAVARLRERGASEAQIERYEGSFVAQSRAVLDAGAALDVAIGALSATARELAG
ncbi:MAG: hypothetical protein KC619_18375 [Myxococcales bacterium]|nr:hypothetical protein [Myxococcales bacterium]